MRTVAMRLGRKFKDYGVLLSVGSLSGAKELLGSEVGPKAIAETCLAVFGAFHPVRHLTPQELLALLVKNVKSNVLGLMQRVHIAPASFAAALIGLQGIG